MAINPDYIAQIKDLLKKNKHLYVTVMRRTKNGRKVCRYCFMKKKVMFSINWELAMAFNFRRDKTGAVYGDPDTVVYYLERYCGLKNLKVQVID